jgi:hypothetical protein
MILSRLIGFFGCQEWSRGFLNGLPLDQGLRPPLIKGENAAATPGPAYLGSRGDVAGR